MCDSNHVGTAIDVVRNPKVSYIIETVSAVTAISQGVDLAINVGTRDRRKGLRALYRCGCITKTY